MQEKKIHEILDNLGNTIGANEYIEIFAVGCLIIHLSEDARYNNKINIKRITNSEGKAKESLLETLSTIQKEVPTFKQGFDMLTGMQRLESSQITRIFYQLLELKEVGLQQLLESIMYLVPEQKITSSSINELAAEILQPKGTLYDGTIGYASGAVSLYEHAQEHGRKLHIYGQEIQAVTTIIAKIHLFIAGAEDSIIHQGDVLVQPRFLQENKLHTFDYVYMDPPIGLRSNTYEELKNDKYNRFFYGTPAKNNADYIFISHALASLNEKGKALLVLSDGSLFRGGADGKIRKNILEADLVEVVVSLPSGFLPGSNIPINLVLFNKNKDESMKRKIQFIKVTDVVGERSHTKSLSKKMISKIQQAILDQKIIPGFSEIVTHGQLDDDILLASRYVLSPTMNVEGIGTVTVDLDKLEEIQTVILQDHATFYRGFNVGSRNNETSDGEYQIIRLSDVQDGKLLVDQIPHYTIENNARIDMYRVQKDDVIVSIRGGVIKAAVIEKEIKNLLLSQNYLGIRCNGSLIPHYIKAFIESPIGQYILSSKLSGTAIQTLNRKDLETLEIPLLPLEEQENIMKDYQTKVVKIENEIEQLKKRLLEKRMELYEKMKITNLFSR